MTEEELEKLKQTIDYFGHWYDVIGEERVLILEKSINYITELKDDLCRVTSDRDGYRTVMLSYEHKIKDLEKDKCELQQDNIILKRKLEALRDILQARDKEMKELRLSVAQIIEPIIDKVLEQEARDWIRHNHELVDRSDFHDEIEYDHARVDDLVEVYVTAVKAHMKKE